MNFSRRARQAVFAFVFVIAFNLKAQQNQVTLPVAQVAPSAVEDKGYKPTSKVTIVVYGRQVEDEFSRSHQGVTVIDPELYVKYGEYLTLGLDLVAILGTGNASNFWNEDGKPPNAILLNEGYGKINFDKNLFVKAGVIRTPINPLTSIMTPGTFIGAQEEWQIGADESNITLTGYEAIPSSGTVSRRIYDDGTQAYFLSQTLAGRLKTDFGTDLKAAATRFQFENLSTNVANDSYFLGNSLESFEGSSKSFRFRYGFMGTETSLTLKQDIGKHEASIFGSTIVNDQAPDGQNKGRMVGGGLKIVSGNYAFRPQYTVFNYDADVIPTTYSLITMRFQNRTGYKVGFDIELIKEKLALRNYYMKMNLKDANPYLADREIYNIALEAKYDIF